MSGETSSSCIEGKTFVLCLQGYICRQMLQYEWFWTPHLQPEAFPSPCWLEDPQPLLQELDREEPARADVSGSSARILKSGQGSESDRSTVVLRLQSVRKRCCQPQPSRCCWRNHLSGGHITSPVAILVHWWLARSLVWPVSASNVSEVALLLVWPPLAADRRFHSQLLLRGGPR